MKFYQLGRDHLLEYYAPERPDSCTLEIVAGNGTVLVDAGTICNIDSVNTTITSSTAGKQWLTVSSSSGITYNKKYKLVHATNGQQEDILVNSSSNCTIFLKYPILHDYPQSSYFKSTRITYTLSASLTSGSYYDNCVAIFSPVISSVSQSDGRLQFCISQRHPESVLSTIDLIEIEPNLLQKLSHNTDIQDIINVSFEQLLTMLSSAGTSAGDIWSNDDLKQAHKFLTLYNLSFQYGPQFSFEQDRLYKIFTRELDILKAVVPVDEDKSGTIKTSDKFPNGIRLVRC